MIDLSKKYALLESGEIEPLQYDNGEPRNAYKDEDGKYYLDHDVCFSLGQLHGIAYRHDEIVKTSDRREILTSTKLYVEKNRPELLRREVQE